MKLAKKHSLALLAFIIVALYVSVTLTQYERKEARYQRELKAFSEALQNGMKREDLENLGTLRAVIEPLGSKS